MGFVVVLVVEVVEVPDWEGNQSPRDGVVLSAWTRLLPNKKNNDGDERKKDMMMECCFHGRRRRTVLAVDEVMAPGALALIDNPIFSR